MREHTALWRLLWAEIWLRFAPDGTPERTSYQRMRTRACLDLGITP